MPNPRMLVLVGLLLAAIGCNRDYLRREHARGSTPSPLARDLARAPMAAPTPPLPPPLPKPPAEPPVAPPRADAVAGLVPSMPAALGPSHDPAVSQAEGEQLASEADRKRLLERLRERREERREERRDEKPKAELPSPFTPKEPAKEAAKPMPAGGSIPADVAAVRKLLDGFRKRFSELTDFEARLIKREVVNGKETPQDEILYRYRVKPQSVYMKTLSENGQGREVLYIAGQKSMTVVTGKGDNPIVGVGYKTELDPDSKLATSRSRHRIYDAGFTRSEKGLARAIEAAEKGNPDVKSISAMAFGPNGILFIGDTASAKVFAIETADTAPAGKGDVMVDKLGDKLGSALGTTADNVTVNDVKVNPSSGNVYIGVTRKGAGGGPVVMKLDRNGKLADFPLKDVTFTEVALPAEELARIRAFFEPRAYPRVTVDGVALERARAQHPGFARWLARNVAAHREPGYAIAQISLKPAGGIPGDATAEQMELVADLAERHSCGEIRVTHRQNLVLPDVPRDALFALWQELEAAGLGSANFGLIGDIIACPGLDFCNLANARSIPIAQQISAHFADIYGAAVSKDTISRITDRVVEEMTAWHTRPLERVYAAVFIDALHVKIRDGQVANRPVDHRVGAQSGHRSGLGCSSHRNNPGCPQLGQLHQRGANPTRGAGDHHRLAGPQPGTGQHVLSGRPGARERGQLHVGKR